MSTQTAVIANGASTSEVLSIQNDYVLGVLIPATWTTADLSIEGSFDGNTFYPCFDASGEQLILAAAAGRMVMLSRDATAGLAYVRFRSGTSAAPVNQGGARTLTVAVADQ